VALNKYVDTLIGYASRKIDIVFFFGITPSTRNAKFCGGSPLNCNTDGIELADKFTLIFV
jgi:hypothetical protein